VEGGARTPFVTCAAGDPGPQSNAEVAVPTVRSPMPFTPLAPRPMPTLPLVSKLFEWAAEQTLQPPPPAAHVRAPRGAVADDVWLLLSAQGADRRPNLDRTWRWRVHGGASAMTASSVTPTQPN
jgi:hypothetical protein